jgi:hypothetical protein
VNLLNQDQAPSLRGWNIAGIDVMVKSPSAVTNILRQTLHHVPLSSPNCQKFVQVDVSAANLDWEINSTDGLSGKMLDRDAALPAVAGAVVSTMVRGAAASRGLRVVRAVTVESQGRAIAMVGDDWEGCLVLAAHLHARGWKYLGGDYALIDQESLSVVPFAKMLYVNSACFSGLPASYRPAIEKSPWYSTPAGLAFYAVDPKGVGSSSVERSWSESGVLSAVIVADGQTETRPSLEMLSHERFLPESFAGLRLHERNVRIGRLTLGESIATADMLERRFGTR